MRLLCLFVCLLSQIATYAQNIPMGSWRSHLSYNAVHTLANTSDRIYAASASGLFYVDRDGAQVFSTTNGLSGSLIDQLAYHKSLDILIVAYHSGKVDLIQDNHITPIIDIFKDKELALDKQVNHIFIHDRLAYFSTNYGVVVLDLKRKEIKESYLHLGTDGSNPKVFASVILQKKLFLATEQGIQYAALSSNLQYFGSYTHFEGTDGIPKEAVQNIVAHQGKLYASIDGKGIYAYDFNTWQIEPSLVSLPSYNLQSIDEKLIVCVPNKVMSLKEKQYVVLTKVSTPKQVCFDANGALWVADASQGLWETKGANYKHWMPNGVHSRDTWAGIYYNNKVLMVSGGYDKDLNPLDRKSGVYLFGGLWENTPNPRSCSDIIAAHYQSQKLFLVSFGKGVLEISGKDTTLIDKAIAPTNVILVTDANSDLNGDLWVSQYADNTPIHIRDKNGWHALRSSNVRTQYPLELMPDQEGNMWVRIDPNKGGGLWVWDLEHKKNTFINTMHKLNPKVLSMATDRDGVVWLGTDNGVQYVQNPYDVFGNGFEVGIPRFDGFQLLRDHLITSIAIDGGNRKWFGTKGAGVFLFDSNTNNLLAHFTTQDSPLLSDNILDIVIHQKTGEVFFCTEKGIISYRSDASKANNTFTSVKIFPNPILPTYTGEVTIQGLAEDAHIKITDVTGKLVFETNANGGTAVWGLHNHQGNRVKTGVYIILANNKDGSEGVAGKIAVVNK